MSGTIPAASLSVRFVPETYARGVSRSREHPLPRRRLDRRHGEDLDLCVVGGRAGEVPDGNNASVHRHHGRGVACRIEDERSRDLIDEPRPVHVPHEQRVVRRQQRYDGAVDKCSPLELLGVRGVHEPLGGTPVQRYFDDLALERLHRAADALQVHPAPPRGVTPGDRPEAAHVGPQELGAGLGLGERLKVDVGQRRREGRVGRAAVEPACSATGHEQPTLRAHERDHGTQVCCPDDSLAYVSAA